MAKIEICNPSVTRISYRQEKGDADYGTCLWADFDFDTETYTLQITSDCGNYAYSWHPTPDSEPFFKLCQRLNPEYVLKKIAVEDVLDYNATLLNAISLLEEWNLPKGWQQGLLNDLSNYDDASGITNAIVEFAEEHGVDIDLYDAWCCIEKTYSNAAKKIVKVYIKHIVPAIPNEEPT